MKKENYYVVQGYMIEDLKLKGIELSIYAIINGFSQNNQTFNGSLKYLQEWTNASKQGVLNALNGLLDKNLIHKFEIIRNGVKYCEYQCSQKSLQVVKKVDGGSQKSLPPTCQKTLPNNIERNNIDNIDKKERKTANGYDKILNSIDNEKLKNTFYEFIKMRKLIKKPMTDFALQKMINKLNKLSNYGTTQIAILEQSITNCWQDIYKLKNEGADNGTNWGNNKQSNSGWKLPNRIDL